MEQQYSAQYLTWMKRKNIMKTRIHVSMMMMKPSYDSWVEKAFAEDSAGLLGGSCVWPPRSYSCSFCRREFRSAQALGGHMNIHRRDRARLKQSLGPQNHDPINDDRDHDDHHHDGSFDYKNNRHYPISSPSMVASSTLENLSFSYVCPQFNPNSEKGNKKKEIGEMGHVETDLSVGLNLLVRRNYQSIGLDEEDRELINCKRHKATAGIFNPISMEEAVDLELRLGDPLRMTERR